jgi:hypothetical protein
MLWTHFVNSIAQQTVEITQASIHTFLRYGFNTDSNYEYIPPSISIRFLKRYNFLLTPYTSTLTQLRFLTSFQYSHLFFNTQISSNLYQTLLFTVL